MPTGLQEPKKGGFEISLATDLYLSLSFLNNISPHEPPFQASRENWPILEETIITWEQLFQFFSSY